MLYCMKYKTWVNKKSHKCCINSLISFTKNMLARCSICMNNFLYHIIFSKFKFAKLFSFLLRNTPPTSFHKMLILLIPIHLILFRIKYNLESRHGFYSCVVKSLHCAFQPFPSLSLKQDFLPSYMLQFVQYPYF